MLVKLLNPHFAISGAFRWMIVSLLVITLALATMAATQPATAFADGGNDTAPIAQDGGAGWCIGPSC